MLMRETLFKYIKSCQKVAKRVKVVFNIASKMEKLVNRT